MRNLGIGIGNLSRFVFFLFCIQFAFYSFGNFNPLLQETIEGDVLCRTWTSDNGVYQCVGTLKEITEEHCVLRIDDRLQLVKRDRLSNRDKLFIAALEFVNLKDSSKVAEALARIRPGFDYEAAVQSVASQDEILRTIEGKEFRCQDLQELTPWRAVFSNRQGGLKAVPLCDFDDLSRYRLFYNREWAAEFHAAIRPLRVKKDRACRNSRFAFEQGLAVGSFDPPCGAGVLTRGTFGLVWRPAFLAENEYRPGDFRGGIPKDIFDNWDNADFSKIKKEIALAKKQERVVRRNEILQSRDFSVNSLGYRNYSVSSALLSNGPVHVKGYYRNDGTYVRSHTRSRPSR